MYLSVTRTKCCLGAWSAVASPNWVWPESCPTFYPWLLQARSCRPNPMDPQKLSGAIQRLLPHGSSEGVCCGSGWTLVVDWCQVQRSFRLFCGPAPPRSTLTCACPYHSTHACRNSACGPSRQFRWFQPFFALREVFIDGIGKSILG